MKNVMRKATILLVGARYKTVMSESHDALPLFIGTNWTKVKCRSEKNNSENLFTVSRTPAAFLELSLSCWKSRWFHPFSTYGFRWQNVHGWNRPAVVKKSKCSLVLVWKYFAYTGNAYDSLFVYQPFCHGYWWRISALCSVLVYWTKKSVDGEQFSREWPRLWWEWQHFNEYMKQRTLRRV